MSIAKSPIKGQEIRKHIPEILQRKNIMFQLTGLTRPTRMILEDVLGAVLEKIGANPIASFHVFSGVTEALLNAVKGNIRQMIFRDEILTKLLNDSNDPVGEEESILEIILDTSPLRDAMRRYVVPEKVKKIVQKILLLEDKVRAKKEKLKEEDQEFLVRMRAKLQKTNFKIDIKITIRADELYLRIRNDAPVHWLDMKRIDKSRAAHKELADQGRSGDYFRPDNVDETESAGFGIAMIDEGFYSMGIDPMDYFTISSSPRNTVVYMRYPIDKLQNMEM